MRTETVYGLYETRKKRRKNEKAKLSKNYILPLELMSNWRNCSVVSDMVISDDLSTKEFPASTRNIISTVTNELLENAIKFSHDRNKLVTLSLNNFSSDITIETSNVAHVDCIKSLKKLVSNLKSRNLDELYFEQLERAITHNDNASGLGFLGILKDYGAKLGIKIQNRPTSLRKRRNVMFDVFVKISLHKEALVL